MRLSEKKRHSSCEFAAKCLMQLPTPPDCIPLTNAAGSLPERCGSSEKYSKFRPHRGLRFMLSPGPRTSDTPVALASSPIALPMSDRSEVSQLHAVETAAGKQVAGSETLMPRLSASSGWRRSPWGPSHIMALGMPYSGKAAVCQQSAPSHRRRSSESLIFPTAAFALRICSFGMV